MSVLITAEPNFKDTAIICRVMENGDVYQAQSEFYKVQDAIMEILDLSWDFGAWDESVRWEIILDHNG